MSFANDRRSFRTVQLACLAGALATIAACKGPDASTFACSSSAECPGDYHCDLGTASTVGTFKCVSGAPTPRTIAADATKFLLSKRPSADGSIRTTILANLGAVTSTPDFVGVRVVASQAGHDLADSPVAADGSVLEFQLPQATAQVSLRVQDDSGHSVPVTGYPEQVELSFAGREVAGTANGATAYDVTNQSDALFSPATWIANGPGPGGRAAEFTATDIQLPDGGVQSSSYASIAYGDYEQASTTSPAAPSFGSFSPPVAGTPVGWQPLQQLATTEAPDGGPSARTAAAVALGNSGFILFGGTDAAGTPVDPQGSFATFNFFQGWTVTAPPAGPLPSARSGAAVGHATTGGSCFTNGFVVPCDIDDFQLVVAGGAGATGTMSNEIQLFDRKSSFTNFSVPPTITNSWKLVGVLPFANAGMSSAAGFIPFNAVVAGANSSQIYAGGMMVGGAAVTAANSGIQGCVLFGAASTNASAPIQPATASCVGSPSVFDAASGGIGFRTGMTLVPDPNTSPTTFYLFGGRKTTGVAGALTNDIWKATIACTAVAPAACTPATTWTQISGGGVGTFPTPRAGAGGALWSQGRLVIYGGTDANGNQNDLWEWDFAASAWRQVPQDQATGVIAPPVRSGFAMTGDVNQQHIFAIGGRLAAGAVTDQLWLAGRESAAKLLVKLPLSLPAVDQATSVKLKVDVLGTSGGEQLFVWDGTTWRLMASPDFSSSIAHLLASPTASGTSFLQADGNLYLLFVQLGRNQFNFGAGFQAPVQLDRFKATIDFK
ncbi:MAG: kelch repeat-containing protein [Myxococcales bacterium]